MWEDELLKRNIAVTTGKTKTVDLPIVEDDDEKDCIKIWHDAFTSTFVNAVGKTQYNPFPKGPPSYQQLAKYGNDFWCRLLDGNLTLDVDNFGDQLKVLLSIRTKDDLQFSIVMYLYADDNRDLIEFATFDNSRVLKYRILQKSLLNNFYSTEKIVSGSDFASFILANIRMIRKATEPKRSNLENLTDSLTLAFSWFNKRDEGYAMKSDFVTKSLVSRTKGKTKTVDLPIIEDDEEDCVQQWVDFMNNLLSENSVSREDLLKHGDNDFWCKMKTLEAVTFDAGWDNNNNKSGITGIKYTMNYSTYLFIGVKLDEHTTEDYKPTFSTFIQLSVGGDGKPSYQVVSEKEPFKPNLKQYTEEGREWYTSRLYKDGWLYEGWWKETAGIRKHPSSDFLEFINDTMSMLHANATGFLTTQDKALEAELSFIIHWDEWIFEKNYEFNDKRFVKSLVTTTTGKTKTVDLPLVEDDTNCRQELEQIINDFFEVGAKYLTRPNTNVSLHEIPEEICCEVLELIQTGGSRGYAVRRSGTINEKYTYINFFAGKDDLIIKFSWRFLVDIRWTKKPFESVLDFCVTNHGKMVGKGKCYGYESPFDYTGIIYRPNWRARGEVPFLNLDNASKAFNRWVSFSRDIYQFFKNLGWSPETVMDDVANDVADWVQFMAREHNSDFL